MTCAQTFNDDFLTLSLPFDDIEYILLDPSCSGSGIRNRGDDTDVIDEERLERLAALQIRMVTYALSQFSKVKRVTYSTCSIHSQENEQVVEAILDQFGEGYQVRAEACAAARWFCRCSSWSISFRTGRVEDKPNGRERVCVPRRMRH